MIFGSNTQKRLCYQPFSLCRYRRLFYRLFSKDEFKQIGFNEEIVQINQAFNKHRLTFRGFHYQKPPFSESKIICCIEGKIKIILSILEKVPQLFKELYR